MSAAKAQTVFWIFAGLMGFITFINFFAYTGTSITRVFFITAGTFGAMSIYGYTKRFNKIRFVFIYGLDLV